MIKAIKNNGAIKIKERQQDTHEYLIHNNEPFKN